MAKPSNFRFWIPLSNLEKGQDDKGNEVMKLGGIASTSRRDTDGESLDPHKFLTNYFEEKGIVNWNHNKSPDAVIGEPTKVEKRKEGLYVESILYPDNPLAQSVFGLAKTLEKNSKTRRLGYSIEGKALQRDALDKTKVTKAMITNIALTVSPKNPDSIVDIVKGNFHEFNSEKHVDKSLDEFLEEVDTLTKAVESETFAEHEASNKANGGSTYLVDITKDDGTRVTVDHNLNVKISKSLDTVSGAALKKESVDGSLKYLQKSECVEKIMDYNPVISIEKALSIYENIKNSAMKNNNGKITDDLLEKALVDLGVEDGLEKGENTDDEENTDDTSASEENNDNIEKGDDDDDDMYSEEEDNDSDDGDEEGVEDDDDDSEGSEEEDEKVEKSTKSKKPAKKMEKSNKDELGTIGTSTNNDTIEKAIADIGTSNKSAFKSLAILMKGIHQKMDTLQKSNDEAHERIASLEESLSDSNNELKKANATLEEVLDQPAGTRKSIPTATAKEKHFEKGMDDDLNKANSGKRIVSASKNKVAVANMIDVLAFKGGEMNEEMARALTKFEAAGTLSKSVKDELEKANDCQIIA